MGLVGIIAQLLSFLLRVALNAAVIAFEILHALALVIIEFVKQNKQWSFGFLCGAVTVGGVWYFVATEFADEEAPQPIRTYTVKAVEAASGNTIVIRRGLLGFRRGAVTLSKIGVPEPVAQFGLEAKNMVNEMVADKSLIVDRYPDDVAWSGIVYTPEGVCIQQELIRRGLAWTTAGLWKQEEQEAKKHKRGIWSTLHADQEE